MSDVTQPKVRDLTPEEVARGTREGRMLLVDVREPNETVVESYPDAVVVPLSSFRSGQHSGFPRKGSGFRLPLGQAVGDRFARGAGEGIPL